MVLVSFPSCMTGFLSSLQHNLSLFHKYPYPQHLKCLQHFSFICFLCFLKEERQFIRMENSDQQLESFLPQCSRRYSLLTRISSTRRWLDQHANWKDTGIDWISSETWQAAEKESIKVITYLCQQNWKTVQCVKSLEDLSLHSNEKERERERRGRKRFTSVLPITQYP